MKNENKHTPGPWTTDGQYIKAPHQPHRDGIGRVFMPPDHEFGLVHQTAANTRLIAAAPELLEALEVLTDLVEDYCLENDSTYIEEALSDSLAAIAKARGEAVHEPN